MAKGQSTLFLKHFSAAAFVSLRGLVKLELHREAFKSHTPALRMLGTLFPVSSFVIYGEVMIVQLDSVTQQDVSSVVLTRQQARAVFVRGTFY